VTAAFAAALLLPAGAAFAAKRGNPTGGKFADKHPRRNQVNGRVNNQRSRISQGAKNGSMTKGQARADRKQINKMKSQEHADVAANGGHLTKGEQQHFNREENAESRKIYDQKH
jgi:hypothetical protein